MQPVAVIIPIYQAQLSTAEQMSFQQCLKTLGQHPVVIVKPHSLTIDKLLTTHPALRVEPFDDAYFQDISGYNRLLLSESFYERFSAYEYILIAQLDVFVFRDDLLAWCRRGYDYIGAPQFGDLQREPGKIKTLRDRLSALFQQPMLNGGFSLRRVGACLQLLRVYHRFFGQWPGNEDNFFSLHFPRLIPFRWLMRLPPPQEALHFAIEVEPRQSVALIGGELPMGCHAWEVYDLDFWRPIFKKYGYVV